MIHIFFVPGMYGNMINYVINRFAFNGNNVHKLQPQFDGSMHHGHQTLLYMHHKSINHFVQNETLPDAPILTPFYPVPDAKFNDIRHAVSRCCKTWMQDKKVVLTSNNHDSAALNLLFQYHKVANGVRNAGMQVFFGSVLGSPYKAWNQNYIAFECMRRWEFREWLSIAWKEIANDWIVDHSLGPDWLVLDNRQFIGRLLDHMRLIFAHCELSWSPDLDKWLDNYRCAQAYILEEFALVNNICDNIVNQQNFHWKELNVIAESLIQSKLRDLGYEIRCQDLDRFPTHVAALSNLLYPVEAIHHA